jgi:hypothetical protein
LRRLAVASRKSPTIHAKVFLVRTVHATVFAFCNFRGNFKCRGLDNAPDTCAPYASLLQHLHNQHGKIITKTNVSRNCYITIANLAAPAPEQQRRRAR